MNMYELVRWAKHMLRRPAATSAADAVVVDPGGKLRAFSTSAAFGARCTALLVTPAMGHLGGWPISLTRPRRRSYGEADAPAGRPNTSRLRGSICARERPRSLAGERHRLAVSLPDCAVPDSPGASPTRRRALFPLTRVRRLGGRTDLPGADGHARESIRSARRPVPPRPLYSGTSRDTLGTELARIRSLRSYARTRSSAARTHTSSRPSTALAVGTWRCGRLRLYGLAPRHAASRHRVIVDVRDRLRRRQKETYTSATAAAAR